MYMSSDNKPVGWWLKHLDRLIEESFERALSAERMTRRDWQAMAAVGDGVPVAAVERELAPFLPEPPARAAAVSALLDGLRERGWLHLDGDMVTPTVDGVRARRRVGAAVEGLRVRLASGVSAEDYRLMIDVLRRMAGNLA